jgi:beta-1,4-mannosyl-glycoprotein beta-1,4-N-acetylglucosaminyltransferase
MTSMMESAPCWNVRLRKAIKIYDTFLLDGELDLLEYRLRENYDDTDIFVLVEAGETYRGQKKPFRFAANRSRFAWADDKIRAIQLNALGGPSTAPRTRAQVQRNSILLGLHDASPEDVVLILDADEIPSRTFLRQLRTCGLEEPRRLQMTRHYQKLNVVAPASTCCIDPRLPFAFAADHLDAPAWEELGEIWSGRSGVGAPVSAFQKPKASPFHLRFGPEAQGVIANAGRHLTAVDPSAQLFRKLGRVFHAEWATDRGTHLVHLLRCEEHAVHHRGWWYAEQISGDLPEDLARLAAACPATLRTGTMPPMWRRRVVRTWAWLRLWLSLPETMVRFIDTRFEALVPLLVAPLIAADLIRHVLGRVLSKNRKLNEWETGAHAHD